MSDLDVTRFLSRNEPFPPFRDASLQRPIWTGMRRDFLGKKAQQLRGNTPHMCTWCAHQTMWTRLLTEQYRWQLLQDRTGKSPAS